MEFTFKGDYVTWNHSLTYDTISIKSGINIHVVRTLKTCRTDSREITASNGYIWLAYNFLFPIIIRLKIHWNQIKI